MDANKPRRTEPRRRGRAGPRLARASSSASASSLVVLAVVAMVAHGGALPRLDRGAEKKDAATRRRGRPPAPRGPRCRRRRACRSTPSRHWKDFRDAESERLCDLRLDGPRDAAPCTSRSTARWTLVAERGVGPLPPRPMPRRRRGSRRRRRRKTVKRVRSRRAVARCARRCGRCARPSHGAAAEPASSAPTRSRRSSKDVGIDQRLDEPLPLDLAVPRRGRARRCASATTSASGPVILRSSTTTARCSARRS